LLHQYSGQEDICVGSPIANRTHPETEPLIGFFVNMLALRSEVRNDDSFTALLAQVKQTTLDAYTHQDAPFEKIVDRINTGRDTSRSPLFQVMFVLQNNTDLPQLHLGDITLHEETAPYRAAKFDLTFDVKESNGELRLTIEYNTDLFLRETAERTGRHFEQLLRAITESPAAAIGTLNGITPGEREELLHHLNDTAADYPKGDTIASLFEAQAARTPGSIAVLFDHRQWTYAELNAKANRLAHYLREQHRIQPNELVAVQLERSEWLVAVLLGILKSGAAYVPIDPAYPQERIDYMLADSRARVVMDEALLQRFHAEEERWSDADPARVNAATDLAYVIYTSGSTGQPKGVMIGHDNATSFLHWCAEEFRASRFDTVFAATSICFDLSVFEIFHTLGAGKQLRMLDNALSIPNHLANAENILLNTVPSVVGNLLREGVDLGRVTVLNMAGEPIPPQYIGALAKWKLEIRNLYGPSEDTTYSTCYRIKSEGRILIGRPIANTQVYLLNRQLQLVPRGAVGEICIGGEGLAKGYLNKPELTAEKFVVNPYKYGDRLYRTGDLGRWLPDGNIEYLGRIDHQVKIRGYRIELGEIENALNRHPAINGAVVIARQTANGSELLAYISGEAITTTELRDWLGRTLPAYMIPAYFVVLKELPLTPNGKVDRKRLPASDGLEMAAGATYTAPRNETEERLANIWAEALGRSRVGIDDNFFEIGGHSLLLLQLTNRINDAFGARLRLIDLMQHLTIGSLSIFIRSAQEPVNPYRITLREGCNSTPAFIIPGMPGISDSYAALAQQLPGSGAVYGLQMKGYQGEAEPLATIEEMAAHNIALIREVAVAGTISLYAHSYGGTVAYEMLRQLEGSDLTVAQVVFLDSYPWEVQTLKGTRTPPELMRAFLDEAGAYDGAGITGGMNKDNFAHLWKLVERSLSVRYACTERLDRHVTLVIANESTEDRDGSQRSQWSSHFGAATIINTPGNHFSIVKAPDCTAWLSIIDKNYKLNTV